MSFRVLAAGVLFLSLFTPALTQSAKDPGAAARKRLFRERFLDHFSLGVEAPVEWIEETRTQNGARWDCWLTYITGSAGSGEKPYWMTAPQKIVADAKRVGSVPFLTWYLLANSAPARYKPGPAQATPVNAKVPATMRDYFSMFKVLMEACAKEAPWPVLVQIEPDEWCHLLGSGNWDPAKVDVKVGSTGMEELKGLPDNLFGWAAAFKRLRDLYAPTNVLLGCTPSGWAPNGVMSGAKMGQTMKAVAGDYDFAVFETGDRDKGMEGKAPPYGSSVNITGSLDAHLKWIADFHAASGLYVFVWQVAVGNTVFATCNNTEGHYCDDLVQTLLEDYPANPTIGRYVRSGCVGWMMLGGQEGVSTHVYDAKKDGITNPAPISGNQGKKSEHPDDDGGYMRLRAAAYYKKPFPILGKGGVKPTGTSSGISK